MSKIKALLVEYFRNKNEQNRLRNERIDMHEFGRCSLLCISNQDCLDFLKWDKINPADMCDFCKYRHSVFLAIRKLGARNSQIMNKLRGMVKDELTKKDENGIFAAEKQL
jgi:hypothetical protein